MTTRRSPRISQMKSLPKYYCDLDSDDDTKTNDDVSNYSTAYEISESDSDDEVYFTHVDSLMLMSNKYKDEEPKDEHVDSVATSSIVRIATPLPTRKTISTFSRFDYVNDFVDRDLWLASKDSLLHKIVDGRQAANDEIITLLAIFAIAQFAHQGSVEQLYNTIGKHPLLAVDNIMIAFKDKCDLTSIIDVLRLRWLLNCFLSKTKINEHIMRKNAYRERMQSLNLENTIRRLFVKDDDRKLQNFVNICDKLYNDYYHTI